METVKLAEDGSGDVVVRLYEALGRRCAATVHVDAGVDQVVRTDLLERPLRGDRAQEVDGSSAPLALRPFEIVTLRCRRR